MSARSARWSVKTAGLAIVLIAGPAAPQTRPPSDPSPVPPRQEQREGDNVARPGSRDGETLSDKLGRTDGVIKPPDDATPSMRIPPPDPGPRTTPVIPPSALPDTPKPPDAPKR